MLKYIYLNQHQVVFPIFGHLRQLSCSPQTGPCENREFSVFFRHGAFNLGDISCPESATPEQITGKLRGDSGLSAKTLRPAECSGPYSLGQWPQVHGEADDRLALGPGCEDALHRAGQSLGERLCGILHREDTEENWLSNSSYIIRNLPCTGSLQSASHIPWQVL